MMPAAADDANLALAARRHTEAESRAASQPASLRHRAGFPRASAWTPSDGTRVFWLSAFLMVRLKRTVDVCFRPFS
jgi:hypothetical protein